MDFKTYFCIISLNIYGFIGASLSEPHTGRSFVGRIVHAQKTTTKIGKYMYGVDYTRNSRCHWLKIDKRLSKLLLMIVHAQKTTINIGKLTRTSLITQGIIGVIYWIIHIRYVRSGYVRLNYPYKVRTLPTYVSCVWIIHIRYVRSGYVRLVRLNSYPYKVRTLLTYVLYVLWVSHPWSRAQYFHPIGVLCNRRYGSWSHNVLQEIV